MLGALARAPHFIVRSPSEFFWFVCFIGTIGVVGVAYPSGAGSTSLGLMQVFPERSPPI